MRRYIFDEWVYVDKVRRSKVQLENLSRKIECNDNKYVYQYRSLENFWTILESDCFWATNARFLNDSVEQSMGREMINRFLPKEKKKEKIISDCYIVCFCEENDKLSQWRGYAEEGVSIGFDFTNIRPFYIEVNNINQNKQTEYKKYYNSCYKVTYIDNTMNVIDFAEKFDLDNSDDVSNIKYIEKWSGDIIPYIKHSGFYEEAESRLVFSNSSIDLSDCIKYRNISKMKVPYIIIKMGEDEEKKVKRCVVRINVERKKGLELKNFLETNLDKSIKIILCCEDNGNILDDKSCYGCTIREAYKHNIGINRMECRYAKGKEQSFYIEPRNEIYISDCQKQKDFFIDIHKLLSEKPEFKDIKIWCDGHLPIRNITVGSMKGKEEIAEGIKHYCNNHYWLKCVDVGCTKIPYRSKLL